MGKIALRAYVKDDGHILLALQQAPRPATLEMRPENWLNEMSNVLGVIPARSLIWLVVVLAASSIISLSGT